VTAQTADGEEVFAEQKIYMPQSPNYGKGDKMVYGPHRKSGMLRDTSIQPGQTKHETFEIAFPFDETEKDGAKTRNVKNKSLDVTVRLWHMPAGGDVTREEEGKGKYLLNEQKRTVTVQ
jgi:hypothetical protein